MIRMVGLFPPEAPAPPRIGLDPASTRSRKQPIGSITPPRTRMRYRDVDGAPPPAHRGAVVRVKGQPRQVIPIAAPMSEHIHELLAPIRQRCQGWPDAAIRGILLSRWRTAFGTELAEPALTRAALSIRDGGDLGPGSWCGPVAEAG